MSIFSNILVGFVAVFHVYVFILEAFLWTTARGRKAFNTSADFAAASRALAINQGVYNLFLAAGLVWALLAPDLIAFQLKLFFLSCVMVAAVVGGLTASKRIMLIQGLPALLALLIVIVSR
jgi:putative membrane protein